MCGHFVEESVLNPDYRDMLSALSEAGVEHMVVGAYALAYHGLPRATGDIDIWVRCTPQNAQRLWAALGAFGAPLGDVTIEDLQTPGIVLQIGVAPRRIDLLTTIDGVEWDEAASAIEVAEIEGLRIPIIGKAHLIQNKQATGRPKDQLDIAMLEGSEE
jgi:hypothetical protein